MGNYLVRPQQAAITGQPSDGSRMTRSREWATIFREHVAKRVQRASDRTLGARQGGASHGQLCGVHVDAEAGGQPSDDAEAELDMRATVDRAHR